MRRLLAPVLLAVTLLTACGATQSAGPTAGSPPSTCAPSPGGRCAADVPWPGPIHVSADGLRLRGVINCGGTLHATESTDTVTLRLHVGAMGPGTMSCIRAHVGVTLAQPLGSRRVVDAVSGKSIHVVPAAVLG